MKQLTNMPPIKSTIYQTYGSNTINTPDDKNQMLKMKNNLIRWTKNSFKFMFNIISIPNVILHSFHYPRFTSHIFG